MSERMWRRHMHTHRVQLGAHCGVVVPQDIVVRPVTLPAVCSQQGTRIAALHNSSKLQQVGGRVCFSTAADHQGTYHSPMPQGLRHCKNL
jgi:hypothetical protein